MYARFVAWALAGAEPAEEGVDPLVHRLDVLQERAHKACEASPHLAELQDVRSLQGGEETEPNEHNHDHGA